MSNDEDARRHEKLYILHQNKFLKSRIMRRISAHLILDGHGRKFYRGILSLDDDGRILGITDTGGNLDEAEGIEFYSGILVPGFVNAHCHLELSHMGGTFLPGQGMMPFLAHVVGTRGSDVEYIRKAAERADLAMQKEGIIAVGDISNNDLSLEIKEQSRIHYHTFIEALGFSPARAEKAFQLAAGLRNMFQERGLRADIVPHAPYSASVDLLGLIAREADPSGSVLSIHNQETQAENELYQSGTGDLIRHLTQTLGIDTSFFKPTGRSALHYILEHLPADGHLLLVHNLFSGLSDIDLVAETRSPGKTWFVLCPGSNLFIQGRIPDFELFRGNGSQVCLGTDSLASNGSLSILAEMKIIQDATPGISLEELVGWSTLNGARALRIDDWAGSLEPGKKPGVNLLTGADITGEKLLAGTKVLKLV